MASAQETVAGPWASQWFVELESAPAADGTSVSALTDERSRFRAAAKAAGVSYSQRFAFRTLFNGVSISAGEESIAQIRTLDGVAAVYPVQTATVDQTASAFEPDLAGVAPGVTFGAYRVFGCKRATSSDVMLAAMERIYRDGADVLNMSIAENLSGWPRSPTAQAASRLVKKGIVVVAGATVVARHPLALDGTTRLGHRRFRLPDGRYYVVMTVEKALADPMTPKESWRSPTFKIDRGRHPG